MENRRIVEKKILDEMLLAMNHAEESGKVSLAIKNCAEICGGFVNDGESIPVYAISHKDFDKVLYYLKYYGGDPLFNEDGKLFEVRFDRKYKVLPVVNSYLEVNGNLIDKENLQSLSMREMFDLDDCDTYYSAYATLKDGKEIVLDSFDSRAEMQNFLDELRVDLNLLPKKKWEKVADDLIVNRDTHEAVWIDAPKDTKTFTVKSDTKTYATFDALYKAVAYLKKLCCS